MIRCHKQTVWIIVWTICVLFPGGTAYCAPPGPPGRIVSLAPAMTEMLHALGLGGHVVGVSTACDRPYEARSKTKIGGMANPSLEAIMALKPDVVVMTREGNPQNIAKRLIKLGKKIYVFKAGRLDDLPTGIRDMGQALGAVEKAEALAKNIEETLRDATAPSFQKAPPGRKALFIIWPKPLIVAGPGTIINDAMNGIGLKNIAGDTRVSYPNFSVEAVIQRQPDLIIIGAAHDSDMKRQSQELLKHLWMLDAVRKGHICYVGDALYRPGPRIAEGLAEMKRCGAQP